MAKNKLFIALILSLLLTAGLACTLPGSQSPIDQLAATLTAEGRANQATNQADRLTLTALANPPTATPIGPIFDAGDGLPTTLIRNIALGKLSGVDRFEIGPGQAHNFLFEGATGSTISLNFSPTTGAEISPVPILLDPNGQTLFRLENGPYRQRGTLLATSVYFRLPGDGIYTLRVVSPQATTYAPVLYNEILPAYDAEDHLPTSQIVDIAYFFAFGSTDASQKGLLASTEWAINYLFEAQPRVGEHPTLIRVNTQGASQPLLSLIGPDGTLLAHDDNQAGIPSAQLIYTLASANADTTRYTIRVRFKTLETPPAGASDNFTLSLEWQR